MMGWQWHQLNHMQAICTLLQKITTPASHHLDFYGPDALPDTQPTVSKHWRQTDQLKNKAKCSIQLPAATQPVWDKKEPFTCYSSIKMYATKWLASVIDRWSILGVWSIGLERYRYWGTGYWAILEGIGWYWYWPNTFLSNRTQYCADNNLRRRLATHDNLISRACVR